MRELKFNILEYLTRPGVRHDCKSNLLGTARNPGRLQRELGVELDDGRRQAAGRAFDELASAGLIAPTYVDALRPDNWFTVTQQGRNALDRHALDELDAALASISPQLVEMRDGAWAAVESLGPDTPRQAAHSARELLSQTLAVGAPDATVRSASWFVADSSSRNGITRRHRLRQLMESREGLQSKAALRVAEKACELALAAQDRLSAMAHSRTGINAPELKDAITAVEIALRAVLLSGGSGD